MKELEDEERKEQMAKTLNETMSKLSLNLDLQKVDNKRKLEASKKRQEETRVKHEELTARDLEKRQLLLSKINQESQRTELLNEQRLRQVQLKIEVERERAE